MVSINRLQAADLSLPLTAKTRSCDWPVEVLSVGTWVSLGWLVMACPSGAVLGARSWVSLWVGPGALA